MQACFINHAGPCVTQGKLHPGRTAGWYSQPQVSICTGVSQTASTSQLPTLLPPRLQWPLVKKCSGAYQSLLQVFKPLSSARFCWWETAPTTSPTLPVEMWLISRCLLNLLKFLRIFSEQYKLLFHTWAAYRFQTPCASPQKRGHKFALASCILFVLGEVCSKMFCRKRYQELALCHSAKTSVHTNPTGSHISSWEEQRAYISAQQVTSRLLLIRQSPDLLQLFKGQYKHSQFQEGWQHAPALLISLPLLMLLLQTTAWLYQSATTQEANCEADITANLNLSHPKSSNRRVKSQLERRSLVWHPLGISFHCMVP